VDEHVWTSPVNAVQIIEHIGAEIVKMDEAKAETYAANANGYLTELLALDEEIRTYVDSVSDPVMVFGDRFPLRYFAEAYGITCYAAFPGCSTQTEPSAATIAYLTDLVREQKLSTVYYIEFPTIWWRTALRKPQIQRQPCSTPATMCPGRRWTAGLPMFR
jgi:zinc transport system substrate-binding protein